MASNEILNGRAQDHFGRVDWLQRSFHLRNSQTQDTGPDIDILFARIYTSAMMKFTDTSPGGNMAINPIPQPSVWTDPPPLRPGQSPGELNKSPNQGSYYSEIYDDNQQVIYMRFGVPAFNSLTGFYSRFYNSSYAKLVRTGGVSDSLVQEFTRSIAGGILSPLRIVPFAIDTIFGVYRRFNDMINFLLRKGSSLYYFKSTMGLYWGAAQSILNHIAVNKGFIAPISNKQDMPNEGYAPYEMDTDELRLMHEAYPDLVTERGNINLYGVATRAQRKFNVVKKEMMEMGSSKHFNDIRAHLLKWYKNGFLEMEAAQGGGHHKHTVDQAEKLWFSTYGAGLGIDVGQDGLHDSDSQIIHTANSFFDMLKAGMNEGAEFVGFRVNNTGSAQESFSNSFRESELGQMINQVSASSRSTRFSLNNGQLMDNILFNAARGVVEAGLDIVRETAGVLGLDGIPGVLMGNAYADIPKFWDNSDVSLSSKSYTIDLFSPYGDVYSQLINIYMPLSLLLAGAMARSTGRHSYTEPFLCQIFDKGRAQTRLGMIKSLSVQRGGNGNVSWTQDQEPLNIRVSLEIEDMHNILHMPLVEKIGSGLNSTISNIFVNFLGVDATSLMNAGWFDLDTPFTDYMAVLGSLDLTSQIYLTNNIKRKWRVNQLRRDIQSTDEYLSIGLTNNNVADVVKMFMAGTFNR